MGGVCAQSGKQSAKRGAALAAIYGEYADSSERHLSAFSAGGIAGMAGASIVLSVGHDGAVESLLYDSPVRGVLWTSDSLVVAGLGAWQRHSLL